MQNGPRNSDNDEAVKIPIEDVLDLHTFLPKEIPGLLTDYLNACREAEIYSVRIIHGKGQGLLKARVHGLLKKLSVVASFSEAPPQAGGWGATLVELKKEDDFASPAWSGILDKGAKAMGMAVEQSQIAQFARHARELLAWNQFANLTAITDPAEIAVKLFLDTLPLAPFVPAGSCVLDIGSGGGFPGIPLKIVRPDLHLLLIDASRKKVSFQKHIIRTLGLKDIDARHIRAEDLARQRKRGSLAYDVIVSKALSGLNTFLALALPLLHRPGIIVAMKSGSIGPEVEAARSRIEAGGLTVTVKQYRLPYLDIERCLIFLTDSPKLLKISTSESLGDI
jgi:16S rRNA (guanine527-N7)-methyltransferase